MSRESTLVGTWLSIFRYSRGNEETQLEERYICAMHKMGNQVVVESLPGSNTYLAMRLVVDGRIATGSWELQHTRGSTLGVMRLWGAVQMVIDVDGYGLRGIWVGFGSEVKVVSGEWELVICDPQLRNPRVTLLEVAETGSLREHETPAK